MLEKGKKVGEYVLLEKLGSGGFGDVWKAEKRTVLDSNHFALKFFRPKEDGVDFDKIGKELAVWKRLRGLPHIISVIELDRFEDYVYVVSDFADGGSLEKWLRTNGGKASSEANAVNAALQILSGLENLHEKGFVHRDLKPDNILIMNGRFCLADFGISREVKTHSRATGTAGTMEYMPPEAFEKMPSVTPQTDIWAVGAILQRLLTGKLPYPQDDQPSLIAAILMSEPDEMPESVNPSLREIVRKSLQKNRAMRFQSANEMREALQNFLMRQKIVAVPPAETIEFEDSDKTAKYEFAPAQQDRPFIEDEERPTEIRDDQTEIRTVVRQQIREAGGQAEEELTRQRAIDYQAFLNRQSPPQTFKKKLHPVWIVLITLVLGSIVPVGIIIWSANQSPVDQTKNSSANKNTNSSSSSNPLKNSIGMEFVKIPAGSFMMGSPTSEKERDGDETQHRVTISKDFYLGKYEVTQEEYEKVMGANPSSLPNNCPRCPVQNVSWEDAQEFIKKLNAKGEGTYRLPTEAEWEYACRAGTTGDYAGSLDSMAWYGYDKNSVNTSHEVGTKQPNAFGLYDMHGNVWEWTADWYGDYPSGSVTDPTGASSGSHRVIRGGSWLYTAPYLRSASRFYYPPFKRFYALGFRVVRQ